MRRLTPHFSLEELTRSQVAVRKGIDNTPGPVSVQNLQTTAEAMERVRAILGVPITVTSGYRSPPLNDAIGGSPTSAHTLGLAVDFVADRFGAPLDICRKLVEARVRFDQLIEEGTWVHISFDPRMRGQVLTKRPGVAGYQAGLRHAA
ncbi:MAG: peptidase M15 [Phenylobacterium sp.]|nr:peptidase M15 [Phenylobacterium sp.]